MSMDPQSQAFRDESRQSEIVGVCIMFMVIIVLTIVLRVYARTMAKVGLWWDDWFAIASVPFAMLPCIFDFVQIHNGFGKHISTLDTATITRYGYIVYIIQLFYNLSLAFFKLSFLALYVRLFPQRWMRLTCFTLGGVIIAWAFATFMLLVFRCTPVSAAWTMQGVCIPQTTVLLTQSVPTIFFDFVILFMPMPLVWRLQMAKAARLAVIGIFLVGSLVTVISIFRLVSAITVPTTDLTWGFVDIGLWSAAEPVAGLLCCSMSTYSPLFKKASHWLGLSTRGGPTGGGPTGYGNDNAKLKSSAAAIDAGGPRSNAGYVRHRDEHFELRDYSSETSAYAKTRLSSDLESASFDSPKAGNIHVRQDVSVYGEREG